MSWSEIFSYKVANIVSLILSYPIIGIFEMIFLGLLENANLSIILIGIVLHSLLPVIAPLIYGIYNSGDLYVSRREHRPLLFIPGIMSYILAAEIFYNLGFKRLFCLEMISIFTSILLLCFSLKLKVSIHVASITIPVFFFYLLGFVQAVLLSPLILLVSWARMRLSAHNLMQIFIGFIIGLTSTFLSFYFVFDMSRN